MKFLPALASLLLAAAAAAAVSTGTPFTGNPPDATHPWAVHDQNRPQPKRVEPGTPGTPAQPGQPPSDAVVLFDGTAASLDQWEMEMKDGSNGGPAKWAIEAGALVCVPQGGGFLRTKEKFGDCQLHVEWAAPRPVKGDSQGRGNSGIFLMGICEVQVLDGYDNPTYADGSANAVYAVNPPMANPLRPPGEFQVVDIVFRRPVYQDAKLIEPGRVTVFCNGVLTQDATPVLGENYNQRGWIPHVYPATGPLKLQDHGDKVRFRNVWYRPLPPRPIDGGADGDLSLEAATAKRHKLAATLRADAATLPAASTAQMLRLAESLVYASDAATLAQLDQLSSGYVAALHTLAPADLEAKKAEAKIVLRALRYLGKFGFIPEKFSAWTDLEQLSRVQAWEEVKK